MPFLPQTYCASSRFPFFFALAALLTLFPLGCSQPLSAPAQQTTSYLSPDQLSRLAALSRATRTRVTRPVGSYVQVPHFTQQVAFPHRVDVYFRALMGLNASSPELVPAKMHGQYVNELASVRLGSVINEPFVSKVPHHAERLPRLLREITKDSLAPGDSYAWLGGSAVAFDIGESRCFCLLQSAVNISVFAADGVLLRQAHVGFVRSYDPFQSLLIATGLENGPTIQGGSGLVLRERPDGAQRMWLVETGPTTGKKPTSFGKVGEGDFNEGNSVLGLTQEQVSKLEWIQDQDTETSGLGVLRIDTNKDYMRSVEQYDNMAFLTLSVAAILSSAAVAAVSIGMGYDRVAVVMVEATVVYSFLSIATHALIVFLRPHSFLVDIGMSSSANFTYQGFVVRADKETLISVVAERLHFPMHLVITQAFSVVAAIAVTCTLIWNVREFRRERRAKKIDRTAKADLKSFSSRSTSRSSQSLLPAQCSTPRGSSLWRASAIAKRLGRSVMIVNFSDFRGLQGRRLKV